MPTVCIDSASNEQLINVCVPYVACAATDRYTSILGCSTFNLWTIGSRCPTVSHNYLLLLLLNALITGCQINNIFIFVSFVIGLKTNAEIQLRSKQ